MSGNDIRIKNLDAIKKNIKAYLNKYIDEGINEILFITPIEKQKKSPTTIPQ